MTKIIRFTDKNDAIRELQENDPVSAGRQFSGTRMLVNAFGRMRYLVLSMSFMLLATLIPVAGAQAQSAGDAPTVTSVSPRAVPISGGTKVTIKGTGFTGVTAVTIGAGIATDVTFISDTEITAVTPPYVGPQSGTTSAAIRVTANGLQSALPGAASVYTFFMQPNFIATPIINQPYSQTITASGGTAPYSYSLTSGALPAGLTLNSNGTISGTPTAAGNYSFGLTVTDSSGGGGPYIAGILYTPVVAAAVEPKAPTITSVSVFPSGDAVGPATGGTTVIINGADLSGADLVTFGGVAGTIAPSGNTSSSLTVTTPPGTVGAVDVAVRTPIGSATLVSGFTYTAAPPAAAPVITAVSPTSGTAGTSVVITGTNLSGCCGASVSFGGIAATVTENTPTQITVTSPAGTTGSVDITVTTSTGTTTSVGAFNNAAAPVVVPAPTVAKVPAVAIAYNTNGTAIDLTNSIIGTASSIAVVTAPAHGTTSMSGNVVTYTPDAGYYGSDSFTFTATGPGGTSQPATVSLTVAPPPAPTVTGRSGIDVSFNSQGTVIDLTSSISGVASDVLIVTPPVRGTATVAGKVVTYTPTADSYGPDSFTFTATGPGGTSAPATVSFTTAGAPPRVQPQSGNTGDGQMVSIELTRGAAIGPFTAAQVVSVSPADAAKTVITSTGEGANRRFFLEATAAPRFGGTVSVSYTLTNAFGVSPAGVVTLTVAARADPSKDPRVVALSDAQVQATRRFGRSQIANFMRRNEQLHSGRARSSQNISVNIADPTRERRPEDSMAPAAMPKRDSDVATQDATDAASDAPAAQDDKPAGILGSMSMWVSGAIDIATRDASSFAPKLSATTQGISGGVDFQISKRTAIGFGGGYGYVTTDISGKAAELRATSNLVAVYGSTKLFENGFVDVVAGHGFLDYKTRRRIDGTELTAIGTRTGIMNLAAVSFGINKQIKALDWSFYSKLEYMDAKLDGYTETSGGSRNNLRLSALGDRSYSAGLGFRLQKAFDTGIGAVTPRVRGEFGREFGKADIQYVDYADIAGATTRSIQGRHNEQKFYQTSIGTMIDLKNDWSFDLEYALIYNTATLSSGIKVQVSRAF